MWPYLLLLVLIWAGIFVGAYSVRLFAGLPDINSLFAAGPSHSVVLLDVHGQPIAVRGLTRRRMVDVRSLPVYVPAAFISIEDRRFRHHFGIDPVGLVRAAYENYRHGGVVQGGSTLTQQLAKNLFLVPDRTLHRKLQEALLALYLEHKYSKDEILTLYLNRVNFGAGVFGIEAAAERFFDKPAAKLSVVEAAILAGSLKAPSRYNPLASPDAAHVRAALVLAAMARDGVIDTPTLNRALATRVRVRQGLATSNSGYFTDWVMSELSGYAAKARESLVVETTLDLTQQTAAERAVRQGEGEAETLEAGQTALVAMTPDGAVRAMIGGSAYGTSPFNRAVDAVRQPGSAFKPVVYLTAFAHGRTPEDIYTDGPVDIHGWKPRNYEGTFQGDIPLWQAFAESSNSVAAQLVNEVGPDAVVRTARDLGISSTLHAFASLALGTSGVSPLELTAAYAAFAGDGRAVTPYAIVRILSRDGRVLWQRRPQTGRRVMTPETLAEMRQILRAVVESGTGKAARLADRPTSGKTGTTQDSRDAWFVGFTADLVCGVWIGNDDNLPMRKATGGGLPARTFQRFMTAAESGRPVAPPEVPAPDAPDGAAEPAGADDKAPAKGDGLGDLIGSLLP